MLSTTYESVICPTYLLRKPLAGFYVMNITDGHLPFTGVIEMTALMDRNYFDGHSLVYLPRYLAFEDPLCVKGRQGDHGGFPLGAGGHLSGSERRGCCSFQPFKGAQCDACPDA